MVLNENVPWVDTIKNRNRRKLAINWLKSAIFGVRILRPILSLFQSIITNLYLFSFELCPFLVRKISFVEVSLPLNFVGCTWILLNLHCHQSPMVSGYTMQWKIKLNVIHWIWQRGKYIARTQHQLSPNDIKIIIKTTIPWHPNKILFMQYEYSYIVCLFQCFIFNFFFAAAIAVRSHHFPLGHLQCTFPNISTR